MYCCDSARLLALPSLIPRPSAWHQLGRVCQPLNEGKIDIGDAIIGICIFIVVKELKEFFCKIPFVCKLQRPVLIF